MEDKRKKAPEEGPNGVDRWTSNGYGITIDGKEVIVTEEEETKEDMDDIEEV